MNASAPKAEIRSDINVTPLVDVCLVLLIIFMVMTPLLVQSEVQLPKTQTPKPFDTVVKQLPVEVLVDGSVRVEDRIVSRGELPRVLGELHAAAPDRPVVLQGDRRLRYAEIFRVLEDIEKAGFDRVALISERQGGG